jgi:hypothetical protein
MCAKSGINSLEILKGVAKNRAILRKLVTNDNGSFLVAM